MPGNYNPSYYKNGVKFIYITMDKDHEVDSIVIKTNPQNVTHTEIIGDAGVGSVQRAEACLSVKNDTELKNPEECGVEAVVFKCESSAVSVNNLLYISNYHGSAIKQADGTMVQGYEVAMLGEGGKLVEAGKIIYFGRTGLKIGTFAQYTRTENDSYDDFYTLRPFSADNATETKGDSVALLRTYLNKQGVDAAFVGANSNMIRLDDNYQKTTTTRSSSDYQIGSFHPEADRYLQSAYETSVNNLVNLRGAQWLDLTSYRTDIESASELKDAYKEVRDPHTTDNWHRDIEVTLLFNDNPESDEFRTVYMIVVNSVSDKDIENVTGTTPVDPQPTTGDVRFADGLVSGTGNGQDGMITSSSVTTLGNGRTTVSFEIEAPSWAYTGDTSGVGNSANVKILYDVYLDDETVAYAHGVSSGLVKKDSSTPAAKYVALSLKDDNKTYAVTNFDLTDDVFTGIKAEELKDHKVSIVLTSVDWRFANVQYMMDGKNRNGYVGPPSAHTYINTFEADVAFGIGIAGVASTVKGSYTITGLTFSDTTKMSGSNVTIGGYTGVTASGDSVKIAADKKQPVVVNFTSSTGDATVKYNVELGNFEDGVLLSDSSLGYSPVLTGGNDKIKVSGPTQVKEGKDVTLTFSHDSTANGNSGKAWTDFGAKGWIVSVKISGVDYEVTMTGDELKGQTNWNDGTDDNYYSKYNPTTLTIKDVQSDVVIESLTVKPIARTPISSATVNRNLLTVVFDGDVTTTRSTFTLSDNNVAGGGAISCDGAITQPDSKTVVWQINGGQYEWGRNFDGIYLVPTSIRDADGDMVTWQTISIATDGTTTVTPRYGD